MRSQALHCKGRSACSVTETVRKTTEKEHQYPPDFLVESKRDDAHAPIHPRPRTSGGKLVYRVVTEQLEDGLEPTGQ